jgi:hypothetical protein
VSAIASAYAESAASSKQDELTFSYDENDRIDAINGSALAGQGGGGEQVVTSLQYAVSESTSTYELYQPAGTTDSYMSSNLLAINDPEYGMGQYDMSSLSSFDVFMTGMDSNFEYYSATMSAMIVKASASGIQPWVWSPSDTAFCGFLVSVQTGTIGYDQTGSARVSAFGLQHYGSSWPDGTPFYIQPPLIFFTRSNGNAFYNGTARIGTAYGSASYVNTAIGGESSVSGVNELPIYVEKDTSISSIAEAYAQSAVSSVSGNYYPRYSNPSNFVQSGNVVMRSSIGSSDNFITSIGGKPLMATDSALATSVSDTASATAYKTAFVNFESDSVSRSVFVSLPGPGTTYITAFDSNGYNVDAGSISLALDPDNYVYTGQYVVTSMAAVSAGVFSYQTLSASAICGYTVPLAHASALPTYSYDAEDKISAINGSALAGGGGGEADWSAESGQPGYIENKPVPKTLVAGAGITITENSTALVVGSTNTLYTAGSGLTLNGTTFAVDPTAVQGKLTYDYDASGNISGIDGSALVGGDPEAADLYVQSPLYTGVSGGSAYIGSRINQTVLWTGTGTTTGGTITLSESLANFERYGMYYYIPYQESGQTYYQEMVYKSGQTTFGIKTDGITNTLWRQYIDYGTMNETSISIVSGRQGGFWLTGTDRAFNLYDGNERHHYFTKVIGINRTAGE